MTSACVGSSKVLLFPDWGLASAFQARRAEKTLRDAFDHTFDPGHVVSVQVCIPIDGLTIIP